MDQFPRLTYDFHSGFVLENIDCILVFDLWIDRANLIPRLLQDERPLYVFASHFHEDHFNPRILDWKKSKKDITFILSKDILRHHRAEKDAANTWMVKGSLWEDQTIRVLATGSNDSGVSWIVELKESGFRLFHAGDLNNWYARFLSDEGKIPEKIISEEFGEINPLEEEKQFLGELKDIRRLLQEKMISDKDKENGENKNESKDFDLVMFPVDGRIGNGYTRGGRQFIERFSTHLFVPMHFVASGYESAWRFKEFAEEKGIRFWSISQIGDIISCI